MAISIEEQAAERHALIMGGLRGLALGGLISGTLFGLAPRYYPGLLKFSYSAKTALAITPAIFCGFTNAQQNSVNFSKMIHTSDFVKNRVLEEHANWVNSSTAEKFAYEFEAHKYQIITGLWTVSMYGSWWLVNRDKLLTQSQKFVQARMYAQALTLALLFGAMGLTMYEKSHHLIKETESEEDEFLREVIAEGESDELLKAKKV